MSWAQAVERITGSPVRSARRLAGGDLDGAVRLDLADGRRIVAKQGPLAAREGAMLRAIAATGAPAPRVLHEQGDLLLMDYVEARGRPSLAGWEDLAAALAMLHQPTGRAYGWCADYRFGPVAIDNREDTSWTRFWGERRLLCHAPHLGPVTAARLERLANRLGDFLPDDPPCALLHGDLWGGNLLFADGRLVALIDPACYHGHREADLAMLTLFDHPPERFFAALALDGGWRERLPVYRLWPLLVHLRLFGESYRGAVERALAECGV